MKIKSHQELLDQISGKDRAYLLLYKKGSEQSDCAFESLSQAMKSHVSINVFVADTNIVRDIHPAYDIKTAPSLLFFGDGVFKYTVKGCHHPGFFNSLFENAIVKVAPDPDGPVKRVTVYTTPTCTWCNTIKTYLRKNGINYREVDVSKDQSAAEAMVRRSGQQGVPQTDINGEIVVGFDKGRINRLLGIQGEG